MSLLSDSDYLHVIAISDKVTQFLEEDNNQLNKSPSESEECGRRDGLYPTTMDNKVKLFRFIDQLNKTKGEYFD